MASMEIYTALSYDEKPYQYYKRWQLIQNDTFLVQERS